MNAWKEVQIRWILLKTDSLLFYMNFRPKAQVCVFINLFLKADGIFSLDGF